MLASQFRDNMGEIIRRFLAIQPGSHIGGHDMATRTFISLNVKFDDVT